MSEVTKPAAGAAAPVSANTVPDKIRQIAAAKRTGLFTYQAGKGDRIVNFGMAALLTVSLGYTAVGAYRMANGYGKKEGA